MAISMKMCSKKVTNFNLCDLVLHMYLCAALLDLQSRFRNEFTSVMLGRPRHATRQCAALSGVRIVKQTKCWAVGCYADNAQPTVAYSLPRKRNAWAIGCNKTMRSPQRRTHCQEIEMLGSRMLRRQRAARMHCNATKFLGNRMQQDNALSGVRIGKQTKFRGNRMQQDNAQPSAAHALPRKRNVGLSDATKTLRSPQRRTHCQENEIPGQSDATRQCAALSGVRIAKKTKC